jgi:hypothetical protein
MHYMVDTKEKIDRIYKMVEEGLYFTINRGRQYGKTTTLGLLKKRLPDDYICAGLSFQGADPKMFAAPAGFCQGFLDMIFESIDLTEPEEAKKWVDESVVDFTLLGKFITKVCKNCGRKIVLLIDEVDAASNNEIFVLFLAMLREKYLRTNNGEDHTFHSVILAGVYDIKNIKHKIVLSGKYTPSKGESQINSPWNIAADFKVDMSFSAKEIETMLTAYENDHNTGMNIGEIAEEIRFYTSGYPYLVSRICMLVDTELDKDWSVNGVRAAMKIMLKETTPLFDDLIKKIQDYDNLRYLLFDITMATAVYKFNADNPAIKTGLMFDILAMDTDSLRIHNKIFEIRIANYFATISETQWRERAIRGPVNEIVKDGVFDMELCLNKFKRDFARIYNDNDIDFLEKQGKLVFLTYLLPILNSVGFYHFESETRDGGKMDLVIDYLNRQFILELKMWYGESRHQADRRQLASYLKSKNADCGYLLTFDFRKNAVAKSKWVPCSGKRIFDVTVRVGK